MGSLFSYTGHRVAVFHVFMYSLIYCLFYKMDEYNKDFFVLLKLHKKNYLN